MFNGPFYIQIFYSFGTFQAAVQQKKLKETQTEAAKLRQKSFNVVKDDILTSLEDASVTALPPNESNVSTLLALAQAQTTGTTKSSSVATCDGPKRLHVTNLPFKVRDTELKNMFAVRMASRFLYFFSKTRFLI